MKHTGPYQDVVGLDVRMEDVTSLEEFEGQEELLAVGAYRLDVETHVLTVLLQDLPQVHTATGDNVSVTELTRQVNQVTTA